MHRVRTHVGDQPHQTFRTQLHAFIQFLRQGHRALGGVAQPVVRRLLQFRGRERRRRIALLFLLRDRCDLPLRFAHRGHNLVGSFLVLYFDVRVFVLDELGFKKRWLAPIQHRVNGPILLRHKRADGYLALDDQAQRHSLHAAS